MSGAALLVTLWASGCGPVGTEWRETPPLSDTVGSVLVFARHRSGVSGSAFAAERLAEEAIFLPEILTPTEDGVALILVAYPHRLEELHLDPGPLTLGDPGPDTRPIPDFMEGFESAPGSSSWSRIDALPESLRGLRLQMKPRSDQDGRGIEEVQVGSNFACAIGPEREVFCWGASSQGQAGSGSSIAVGRPSIVEGLRGAWRLSVGSNSSCALFRSGELMCWGKENSAVLGRGPTTSAGHRPEFVVNVDDAVQVAVGSAHACAVKASGRVVCWGSNQGELGPVGPEGGRSVLEPEPVLGLAPVVQIAVGADHSCARVYDGSVWCWGSGARGQRGAGTLGPEPTKVEGLPATVELVSGSRHLCARLQDRTVRCWGENTFGQLGSPTSDSEPTPIESPLGAIEGPLFLGVRASCVLNPERPEGACAGSSTGLRFQAQDPISREGFGAEALSLGLGDSEHACMLRRDGSVACWGRSTSGQLGNSTVARHPQPVQIPDIEDARRVTAGTDRSCVFRSDGWPWCFGSNLAGTLSHEASPFLPSATRFELRADQIALGGYGLVCARTSTPSAEVSCWGRNEMGQLGRGELSSGDSAPGPVLGSQTAFDLGVNNLGGCMVLAGGEIRCWGTNSYRHLGVDLPAEAVQTTPAPVSLDDVRSVTAGGAHVCARVGSRNEVFCWGGNKDGQLGNGSIGSSSLPVSTGLVGAVEVVAGASHTCARLEDGSVSCWGLNKSGEAGSSSRTDLFAPAKVSGIDGAAGLALGGAHTCVLRTTGRVVCFGRNDYGQIGSERDAADFVFPEEVTGLSDVVSIAAGDTHTCAVQDGGKAWCWGFDASGQLGIGTEVVVEEPTTVLFP